MTRLIITLTLLISTINSFACDCIKHSVEKGYTSSDFIVSGIVLTAKRVTLNLTKSYIDSFQTIHDELYFPQMKIYEYTMLVTKLYKGQKTNDTISIRSYPSNCYLDIKVGKSYIVFANKIDYMQRLYDLSLTLNTFQSNRCTNSCSYSKSLDRQLDNRKKTSGNSRQ